jgi:ferritin-like metal-binding protein YciE
MKLNNLNDLFIHELKDVYNAEQQIMKALPLMAKQASSADLKRAFDMHLGETETQIERLEMVFDKLGMKAKGEKCKAMEGIIKEAQDMMSENADSDVMDAALIACAQRVEHYEIAGYGTLCTYAKQLGQREIFEMLHTTLEEEKATDLKLTEIAETKINLKAQHNNRR